MIRIEDRDEAAKYDIQAAMTNDPEKAESLRWLADLLRSPLDHWPSLDNERSVEDVFRDVTDELGDLHAYDDRDDTFVRLPVRVVMRDEPTIEIGPYDLTAKDISVLRRATAAYDRLEGSITYGPPIPPETHPEFWADELPTSSLSSTKVVNTSSQRGLVPTASTIDQASGQQRRLD